MKRIKTELPITIITDDEYKQGDNLEMTRQRIEKAAMLIGSIFSLLKVSALTFEGGAQPETQRFLWDLMNTCEIGYGLADSIMASTSCLTEFIPDEVKTDTAAPELDSLANRLSYLLTDDDLPTPIYNAIMRGVSDIGNTQYNEFLAQFETSPEYLSAVFAKYKRDE